MWFLSVAMNLNTGLKPRVQTTYKNSLSKDDINGSLGFSLSSTSTTALLSEKMYTSLPFQAEPHNATEAMTVQNSFT